VRTVHEKWRDYAYKCPHCNSLFGTAGGMSMRIHCIKFFCKTVHERRRGHKCPHFRFGTAGNMRAHSDL
jgi:hypothetical protein